jgi:hypothetical protein
MFVVPYGAKRRILEIILSNCTLNGGALFPTIRKPFDVLAEGLVAEEKSGGNRTPMELFLVAVGSWEDSLQKLL